MAEGGPNACHLSHAKPSPDAPHYGAGLKLASEILASRPLGLSGGEMIDSGLNDLVSGKETIESLVVSLAAPRLRREGIPLPTAILPDADRRLYRLIERTTGDLAHARYLARLRQVASFADACRVVRRDWHHRAR